MTVARASRLVAAALLSLVVLAIGAGMTLGHSELVSSLPASGQVLAEGPSQVLLAFSEAIDPSYSSLDLVDQSGRLILGGVGSVGDDGRSLVAPVPPLQNGAYTIRWRAFSAADGHVTSGFLSFGVGAGTVLSGGAGTGGGVGPGVPSGGTSAHSGAAHNTLLSRTAAYVGEMLAFGLGMFGWLVLRPVRGELGKGLALGMALALAVAAGGAVALLLGSLGELGPGADPTTFLFHSRVGSVLLARAVVAGGLVPAVLLVRRWRPSWAVVLGGASGALLLVLTAAMSHAAAAPTPTPFVADLVHLGGASVWFSGLVGLTFLSDFGSARGTRAEDLGAIFWRFSALSAVAIGLTAATGVYAAWSNTHDFSAIVSTYSLDLLLKVVVVVLALVVGAVNYLRSGPELRSEPAPHRVVAISWRVLLEATLAFTAVVFTADLTGGSPPANGRPIPIAPIVVDGESASEITLALQPARPGPNQAWAVIARSPGEEATVTLDLQRLDAADGEHHLALGVSPTTVDLPGGVSYAAGGLTLARDSRWQATVVVTAEDGHEVEREEFAFALGPSGLVEGREHDPVDPGLLAGIVLLAVSATGAAYWIRGGGVPLAEPWLGRRAMGVGAILGAALGVLILLAGGTG